MADLWWWLCFLGTFLRALLWSILTIFLKLHLSLLFLFLWLIHTLLLLLFHVWSHLCFLPIQIFDLVFHLLHCFFLLLHSRLVLNYDLVWFIFGCVILFVLLMLKVLELVFKFEHAIFECLVFIFLFSVLGFKLLDLIILEFILITDTIILFSL
jgi:hypothetical protein